MGQHLLSNPVLRKQGSKSHIRHVTEMVALERCEADFPTQMHSGTRRVMAVLLGLDHFILRSLFTTTSSRSHDGINRQVKFFPSLTKFQPISAQGPSRSLDEEGHVPPQESSHMSHFLCSSLLTRSLSQEIACAVLFPLLVTISCTTGISQNFNA